MINQSLQERLRQVLQESHICSGARDFALAEEARKWAIETIKKTDPLEACADWDNGDDIAYSVKKMILEGVKKAS